MTEKRWNEHDHTNECLAEATAIIASSGHFATVAIQWFLDRGTLTIKNESPGVVGIKFIDHEDDLAVYQRGANPEEALCGLIHDYIKEEAAHVELEKMNADPRTKEALDFALEVSTVAQAHASLRQQFELANADIPNPWPCVSCGKPIERDENIGYECGAVVMQSTAGYGSRHDMSAVKFVICDDCVEKKAIIVDWQDKMHEEFEIERARRITE